ncbi:hypothetical protein PPL_10141 [Heterostelium album PN500]|uniref:Uncharacterized protein n=1 Tax=Heterostelium pallidum (strain ATCC 26659 / Pp 5 / PN500) TaxID=670386 RepID=D3BQF6_HETP5|nr:hypothetical protein PPL_10141 [Heterostelium album PN500]EFA76376.1 hypothetical protein PPL_10141 [Heterostelium album PN500]|eukprot:XP_020428508.1 hypothetical protein PPL_10141 [Heterostelium album PN500]
MTLIKSISLLGNTFSGLDKNTTSDIAVSTGNSSIDSENQEQCFGWGRRRRATTVIFGDVNVFNGGCGGFGSCGEPVQSISSSNSSSDNYEYTFTANIDPTTTFSECSFKNNTSNFTTCQNIENAKQAFETVLQVILAQQQKQQQQRPPVYNTRDFDYSSPSSSNDMANLKENSLLILKMVANTYQATGNTNIDFFGLNVLITKDGGNRYSIDMTGAATALFTVDGNQYDERLPRTSIVFENANIVNCNIIKKPMGNRAALFMVKSPNTKLHINNCQMDRIELTPPFSDIFYFEMPWSTSAAMLTPYNLTITNSLVSGTTGSGNLVYALSGLHLNIDKTNVRSNLFQTGIVHRDGSASISSSNFQGNRAIEKSLLSFTRSSVAVVDSTFSETTIDSNQVLVKSLFQLVDCVAPAISSSSFKNNNYLSQIAAINTSLTLTDNHFQDNNYATYGSAIFIKPYLDEIEWNTGQAPSQLNSELEKQRHEQALAIREADSLVSINKVVIHNNTFIGNSANFGGAIYSNNVESIEMTHCRFHDNNAGFSGFSIYSKNVTNLAISNSNFSSSATDNSQKPITCYQGGSLQFSNITFNNIAYSNSFDCSQDGCNIYSNSDTHCSSSSHSHHSITSSLVACLFVLSFIFILS